jgi:drug/metabolite transporter (DMT)-like permease
MLEVQSRPMMGYGFVDVALATSALVLTALAPVLKRLSQHGSGEYAYNENMIYFWAELAKLAVAFLSVCMLGLWAGASVADHGRFCISAFLYFAQNNLGFVVLKYISPGSFQLLMNLRIVAVALLGIPVLGQRPSYLHWHAILLISLGGMQHFASTHGDIPPATSLAALFYTMLVVILAAMANVYNQYCLQYKTEQPLMYQNMLLYIYGVGFNALNWARSVYIEGRDPIGTVDWLVVLLVVECVVYGLCISWVLKRFGALSRSVIAGGAVVLLGVVDFAFGWQVPSLLGVSALFVMLLSVQLYVVIPKQD